MTHTPIIRPLFRLPRGVASAPALLGLTLLLTGCATSSDIDGAGPIAAPHGAGALDAAAVPASYSNLSEPRVADSALMPVSTEEMRGSNQSGTPGYRIGPQDVLEISVFKVADLNRSVTVADTGTVSLPLVGEVSVAGRTAQEVERELTLRLGADYLQSPQVSVTVREYNSQRITIDGAVKKPGVLPYRNTVSLLQVIASADGLADDADSTVAIFRSVDGQRSAARFDISEIRNGHAPDPEIKPGDVIVAGSSAVKAAFNNVIKALPLAGLFVGL